MQHIADSLGVSKGTVSLVLSGKSKGKRVSAELCEKVFQKARELNYQPNELARGLRTGQTKTLGVIVADISNEFFGHLTFYIQEHSKQFGYTVITTNTDESPKQLDEMVTLLINRQVDGIIMVPTDNSRESIRRILDLKIPLVQIDRCYSDVGVSSVVLDNYDASRQVTERLWAEGCRRIAMIRHKNNMSATRERSGGVIDTLEKYGAFDPELLKNIDYQAEEEDMERVVRELKENPEGVDAVFFYSHELFICGVKHMFRMGIRIPQDMRVACFDKIEAFSIIGFPLIFIEQPIREMAEKAVDILLARIRGSEEVESYVFKGKIDTVVSPPPRGNEIADTSAASRICWKGPVFNPS